MTNQEIDAIARELAAADPSEKTVEWYAAALDAAEMRGYQRGIDAALRVCATCDTKDGCLGAVAALRKEP